METKHHKPKAGKSEVKSETAHANDGRIRQRAPPPPEHLPQSVFPKRESPGKPLEKPS